MSNGDGDYIIHSGVLKNKVQPNLNRKRGQRNILKSAWINALFLPKNNKAGSSSDGDSFHTTSSTQDDSLVYNSNNPSKIYEDLLTVDGDITTLSSSETWLLGLMLSDLDDSRRNISRVRIIDSGFLDS